MRLKKIFFDTTKKELVDALKYLAREIDNKWKNEDVDGIGKIITVTISQRDRKR